MYLDYFSLERHPFRITPDTSLFFPGGEAGRGVVLEAMLYAIATGEGILKVVGEVGSGKTMLCRMLEERLPETTEIVYLANPNLSPDEILYTVAFELKLPVRRDTSKLLVMQQLQNYLLRQHAANRKVLVVIEEAQGMPVETLEEIRLFSNLETHRDKLMQIILFGQPELDRNLSARNIRQLRERITHSFQLQPMNKQEASAYIRFRLSAAGCPCPTLFTPRAEWLIATAASGLTRRINILSDKALLSAFASNVREDQSTLTANSPPVVGIKQVIAAIQDSEYSASVLHALVSPLRLLGATMLVALITAFLLWPETNGIANQTTSIQLEPGSTQVPAGTTAVTTAVTTEVTTEVTTDLATGVAIEPVNEAATAIANSTSSPITTATATGVDKTELETDVEPVPAKPVSTPLPIPETPEPILAGGEGYTESGLDSAAWQTAADSSTEAQAQQLPAQLTFTSLPQQPGAFSPVLSARGLVHERVLASIPWLHKAAGNGYTVQFLSGETKNLEFAEAFLQLLSSTDLLDESYVCMSADGSSSYWTIKYGNFPGMSYAKEFVAQLPVHIQEYQPFVQNISSVVCNTNNTIAALMLE